MGLIRAATSSIGSTMADQWLEFFYQDAMPDTVLVTKGLKRVTGKSVNRGNDNIISNGSGIAVADGQCMMIIEQGKIMDMCAEPGQYTWNQSSEPSVFSGSLGKSVTDTFKTMARRFTHGGSTGKDQRVYYFNIRELVNNKFGTATPIPFRVVDTNIGLDIDITLRCNGVFSYKMTNPMLFYTNVSGNVEREYTRDMIDTQLRSEFLSALQPAFAKLSAMGLRYSAIPGHTLELSGALNEALTEKWGNLRGLEVISVAINSLAAPPEDEQMIRQLQRKAVMRDPGMAGAALVNAQAEAMQAAAANTGGAMAGFLGMGMAQQAGGMNAQDFFAMNQQNQQQQMQQQQMQQQQQAPPPAPAPQAPTPAQAGWSCSCGATNTANFCGECGSPRPAPASWTCNCGAVSTARFCGECGAQRG